ncbi:hypothetical protein [Roseibium sp.]|uniref:hypothetical protein n=1 Tax=Roseibium sp. TaxID=1936156 RepID=UPI003D141DA3
MSEILKQMRERAGEAPGKGHRLLRLLTGLVVASVALTWFWSTSAVDMFAAPPLRFSDAFAGVLALLCLAYGCGVAFQLGSGRDDG